MKISSSTIQLLFLFVLLGSCKKESILEKEASLSDRELLERGQLIYFNGSYRNHQYGGLFSGKLLSNDTVKITTLYNKDDYGDEVFPGYETPLMINSSNNTAYWISNAFFKADLSPASNSVNRIGGFDDYNQHYSEDYAIDIIANKIYFSNINTNYVGSFDLKSHVLENKSIKVEPEDGENFAFTYLEEMVCFDGYLYLFYSSTYYSKARIVKLNITTGKVEKLYEGEQDGLVEPGSLVIDKVNRKLYVTDRDGVTSKAIIREGNLEGTGKMEKILEIGLYEGNIESSRLQYDRKSGYLFWYDPDKESIGRIKKGESSPKYWFMEYVNNDFTVPEIDN